MQIECLNLRKVKHDVLKYVSRIRIVDLGLIINDVKLFEKGDRVWAAFPTNSYEKEGEKIYYKIVQFEDKEKENAILKDVKDAILKNVEIGRDTYARHSEDSVKRQAEQMTDEWAV